MGAMRFVYMAKADAQVRWFNVSTAEPAVCAPVNLCRQLFLRCVRALSEARSALALRPERVAVSRTVGIRVELGYTNS